MSVFPFSAIVGQDDLKRALLVAAIDPLIGGVLAFGDRGTGKSTAIRALAALLPEIEIVDGCAFQCDPQNPSKACGDCPRKSADGAVRVKRVSASVVNMPLGATEDRVLGSLDLERALVQGEMRFEPGLLAKAHRGFLYVDEVNLLDDNLVDVLLDVAASGVNRVEREGLSIVHPARFVLVGSGNPEEGDLRPQLLDRFGLSVDVKTPAEIGDRIEVIKRREAFERDREGFIRDWTKRDVEIRRQVTSARKGLDSVQTSDAILRKAAELCIALGSDGLRGELTLMRAARAWAALNNADAVESEHLKTMAPSALSHRLRKDPLDDTSAGARVERAMDEVFDR
ncbi:MAG: magnesium chelatase ATPase subunit I [Pseudomonadota bacterium]